MPRSTSKPLIIDLPELMKIWDYEKNAHISLEGLTSGVNIKAWWKGECNHEWERAIGNQAQGQSCPFCVGSRLLIGFNDLSMTHPHLATLWDSAKNGCQPSTLLYRHQTSANWICPKGHQWLATMASVNGANEPCPYCGKRQVLKGYNDLESRSPDLLKEWDWNKNDIPPSEVLANSSIPVNWICSEGHSYVTAPNNRARGRACPICSGKQVLAGVNDAATIYPHLVREWDHSVPNNTPMNALTSGSNKRIHWVCKDNHKFIETVPARGAKGRSCPTCSGRRTLSGFNDIATTFPTVASEWHPTKNGELSPLQFSAGSHKKVWWLGPCGHEWQSTIYHRTGNGRGCPVCAGKRSVIGFNDALSAAPPHIVSEYNEMKNGRKLSDFVKGSETKVWWKCPKGHEWKAPLRNRILLGTNCPNCNSNVSKAEKDLADHLLTIAPDIKTSVRGIIDRFELDMYIPSKNIAIEYNGVHWHSEANKKITRTYHYNKWKACKDKGIQLIQIWEDEWNRNPEQIKRMLAHKLGVSTEHKVFARRTKVVELTKGEVEPFLNENHIQGYASGSYYLGLMEADTEELVSALVLKNEAGSSGRVLNIIRYATSANVVGGFTKLLKFATTKYQPNAYITFSDNCVSDGGLYKNNGFVADKELPPDYMYVVGNVRRHKFGYRLKRFRDDPALIWEEGLTERELANLNGLKRIWDAGKTRWVLSL